MPAPWPSAHADAMSTWTENERTAFTWVGVMTWWFVVLVAGAAWMFLHATCTGAPAQQVLADGRSGLLLLLAMSVAIWGRVGFGIARRGASTRTSLMLVGVGSLPALGLVLAGLIPMAWAGYGWC